MIQNNINVLEMVKLKMMMGSGNEEGSIYAIMIVFIFSIIEQHFSIIWKTIQSKFNDKYNNIVSTITPSTNDKYSIFIEKDLSKSENGCDLEAILHNISQKYNLKSVLFFKKMYVVNFYDQFNIQDNLYGKLHKLEFDSDCNITQIKIQLSSDELTIIDLKNYINKCVDIYKRQIQNNLGSDLYFFNQKANKKIMDSTLNHPFLIFEYNKFNSNRNFNNVFGENVDILKKRVEFFKNQKQWYNDKGIPYTFGALLHGPPGTGKTSIIKAIANECNRHIVNINLREVKTNTQLKNIFYKNSINCQNDFESISFEIDISEKLYIIEDIDCMNSVVLDRGTKLEDIKDIDLDLEDIQKQEYAFKDCEECKKGHHEEHCYLKIKKYCIHCQEINKDISKCIVCKENSTHCHKEGHCENFLDIEKPRRCMYCFLQLEKIKEKRNSLGGTTQNNLTIFNKKIEENKKEEDDQITLSSLLNILDGTLELPGRMIIITTNYPEKLDSALIRPGRIDLILELGKASKKTIKEMYESFYSTKLPNIDDILPELKLTPAEINCIFFNNFNNSSRAIDDIVKKSNSVIQ